MSGQCAADDRSSDRECDDRYRVGVAAWRFEIGCSWLLGCWDIGFSSVSVLLLHSTVTVRCAFSTVQRGCWVRGDEVGMLRESSCVSAWCDGTYCKVTALQQRLVQAGQ